MEFLIQPTTEPARSTLAIGIPHLIWSPVDARNTTVTPSGSQEYPGAERAPRKISIVLVRSREDDLPANAKLYVQLLVYPATYIEGELSQPAVYQTLAVLTPDNPEWTRDFPVDVGRLFVAKDESEDAYGAVCLGMFGESTQVQE